jgi:acyl transferase domain-containing protein/NAD(P)H-dependent flavin oxidoreductase YrpB (nitropropane dioxygenase family)/NAD(P)-dependent dehydrogenase (short-subunit alcohol dehydrogenase family)
MHCCPAIPCEQLSRRRGRTAIRATPKRHRLPCFGARTLEPLRALPPEHEFEILAATPASHLEPSLAIAAVRAGYRAVVDLEYADFQHPATRIALTQFAGSCKGLLGVKCRAVDLPALEALGPELLERLGLAIVTPSPAAAADAMRRDIAALRRLAPQSLRVLLEVVEPAEAALAEQIAADGLVAKGNESGGRVGESTSFILLQQLRDCTKLPFWAQGGIGLHTVAAAFAAGAAGVVLDQQLLLTRESRIPAAIKQLVARSDGSETVTLGDEIGFAYRVFSRPGPLAATVNRLSETAQRLARAGVTDRADEWCAALAAAVTPAVPENSAWLVGQDVAFAQPLARDYVSVAAVMNAFRQAVGSHLRDAQAARPMAPGSALALSHGTIYPIVQGPMTRVSDRARFALRVAEGGGLPFLALALMRGPQVERLLKETDELLAAAQRPWGVGILGFVPPELREEQLAAVRAARPTFALIAGGRPEQAAELEAVGIPTYLHVPSPGLLQLFLEAGAKRFVFEGRECGGHVGPRSSFVLWNQMVDVLEKAIDRGAGGEAADIHVLFAGGIHDRRSSAMVAAAAAPLARRGCRIGVLMGTAYTFTDAAVEAGAIVETFQDEIVNCTRTALLETGPGHAIRCVETPFVTAFAQEKWRLIDRGTDHDSLRDALEDLNIGRLRIATKGTDRNPAAATASPAEAVPQLRSLDSATQRAEGLYMIGQVALLRDQVTSIAALHEDVSMAGTELLQSIAAQQQKATSPGRQSEPVEIAIVGMGCILPGAPDLAAYWQNILGKVSAIREIPDDRWDWRRYFDADPEARDKIYSKWGGFIDDVPFDPLRYGIPPNSLKSIEPLHLLTLETVRAALHDAGFTAGQIADQNLRQRTSVILGCGGGTGSLGQAYAVRASLASLMEAPPAELYERLPEWTEDSFPGVLINVAAGRVANRFDLGGVNFTVDAACGSSLAAVRLAVQELVSGSSDMVIVGGADTFQNPFDFTAFSKTHALSKNGRCSPFDAAADGIAISEGIAIVVLRRLPDALREGARVYACIRGVGGSSDGRDKSLTAPRPEGQALALERAYRMAQFSPDTVGLIEAHGTGTIAGDRAEVTTLKTVFSAAGAQPQSCAIGSVKSMIGHTKCAAGTAGLIKASLALYHHVVPPTGNVEIPNPEAQFSESPFYVAGEARPWIAPVNGVPRRAGVSAFGFGGTNFHVALEEFDGGSDGSGDKLPPHLKAELFLFSAAAEQQLADQVAAFASSAAAASAPPEIPAATALHELAFARWAAFSVDAPWRLAVVAASHAELVERLAAFSKFRSEHDLGASADHSAPVRVIDPRGVYLSAASATPEARRIAFLFPGQGSQYPNMLHDLALQFPDVAAAFARADATLSDDLPTPLSRFIFPVPAFDDAERKAQQKAVTQTQIAQPAIGAASVAMAHLLASLGITADAAAGHSYGEYVALHHGGAYDEATLIALSAARGRCMVEEIAADPGTMASIQADAETVARHIAGLPGAQVANHNAPDQTVIAGPKDAIARACEVLGKAGLSARPLPVACGFHSGCVAPARNRFAEVLSRVAFTPTRLPVFSNTTAAEHPSEPDAIAALLADHMVQPVNFQEEIRRMYATGIRTFVEVGPNNVLTGLVGRILKGQPHLAVASDVAARPGTMQLQHLLGQLAAAGLPLRLDRLYADCAAGRREADSGLPLKPTTWLVNGGYARRAAEPRRQLTLVPAQTIAPVSIEAPHAVAATPVAAKPVVRPAAPAIDHQPTPAAGVAAAPVAAATAAAPRAARPVARAATGAMPIDGSVGGRSQVMLQYQKLMGSFLATQQQVMLAYLGAATAREPLVPGDRPVVTQRIDAVLPVATTPPAEPEVLTVTDRLAAAVSPPPPSESATPAAATIAMAPVAALPTAPRLDAAGAAAALVELIGERTGYPAEMLGLDLNIEADLGIDSIKRVEILGAFRKEHIGENTDRIRAAMEMLTRKKTLREVADGLAELLAQIAGNDNAQGEAPAPVAATNAMAPVAALPAAPRLDAAGVAAALVELIGERTGYPTEMLGLDLNIEADLGIDSIKRVEILGAFRKEHIGESTDRIRAVMETLTRKKTLREVANGLAELLAQIAGNDNARSEAPAPAAATIATVPVAALPAAPRLDTAGVAAALVELIGERTGYPTEMLGLDLNIEADLGIDSIKRVEILGAFRKEHIGESTDRIRSVMEVLTRKKTLREVADGLSELIDNLVGEIAKTTAAPANKADSEIRDTANASDVIATGPGAPRFAIVPVECSAEHPSLRPEAGSVYLITDDEDHGVARALAHRLQALGARPVVLRHSLAAAASTVDDQTHVIDLSDLAVVRELVQHTAGNGYRFGGIFHCLPLKAGVDIADMSLSGWHEEIRSNVKSLFNLAVAADGIRRRNEGVCVLAATRLGGTLGVDMPASPFQPAQGGVPGLLKTLDKEWDDAICRNVDFAADGVSSTEIAERLLLEAGQPKGEVEIGYRGARRFAFEAEARPLSASAKPQLAIDERSVILVTGGARGITAEVAGELAERYRPILILCGSTPAPDAAENANTAALTEARQIKAALIDEVKRQGAAASPGAIEAAYRRLLKDREIRANLELLRASASQVEYHQVDVRDEAAFGDLIDAVYARFGRLDGVIHGAGIIEDKLIGDKTGDSFDRVVETKTASAFILARKLRPDSLRFFAMFASVAGRFGNRGQSDYGAANEILSKLALLLNRRWPSRVVAIGWGPWDKSGMVSEEVKAQFLRLGIEAIPPQLGRAAFEAEVRLAGEADAEIVWGEGPWRRSLAETAVAAAKVSAPSATGGPARRQAGAGHDSAAAD